MNTGKSVTEYNSLFQHLFSVFVSQGYNTLELFSEVEEEDLDDLAITIPEERAKVLTAAQMLLDYEGQLSNSNISCHCFHHPVKSIFISLCTF